MRSTTTTSRSISCGWSPALARYIGCSAGPTGGRTERGRWENANGLGGLLARQLVDVGETVLDVPAPLAAQARRLSGSRHKSDQHDAHSTAVAGRRASALRPVDTDPTPVLLGLLVERRWHVVSARQKTLVRIHESS